MPLHGVLETHTVRASRFDFKRRALLSVEDRCLSENPMTKSWPHPQPSRHARGYGSAWDRLRIQILKRDHYLCVGCMARGRYTPAVTVDHIISRAKHGTDDPSNLQSLCRDCTDDKDITDHGGTPRPRIGADGYPVE